MAEEGLSFKNKGLLVIAATIIVNYHMLGMVGCYLLMKG
jgi:hypothetical protein